jgi:hypothetical protein
MWLKSAKRLIGLLNARPIPTHLLWRCLIVGPIPTHLLWRCSSLGRFRPTCRGDVCQHRILGGPKERSHCDNFLASIRAVNMDADNPTEIENQILQ